MFHNRSSILQAALLTATASILPAAAATRYWDVNGSTAGSGNAAGVWEVGNGNWNTLADGTGTPAALFTNGDSAVFSAGTDGTGTFTVTLNGTVATPLIQLEETGLVTLSGGTIDITGGSTINTAVLAATTGRSLTWNPIISGSGALTVAGHGDTSPTGGGSNTIFTLSGANTFTGDVTINSGVVGYLSNFGDAANKIIGNGGGLVFNTSGPFARNIEAGAGGAVLRLYGASLTTHNGVLSGSGVFRRTDGGEFIVTQTATHTGNWAIERGTVTVSDGTATTDLLASSGIITLGDGTGGGSLRYRLNNNLTWTTPASDLVFANIASGLFWQAAQPTQALTINSAVGSTTATGRLVVQNGEIKYTNGASVSVNELATTNTNFANARHVIEGNAAITARYLNIGDGGSTTGTITQTGGTLTMESGGNGIRIGHWTNGTNPGSVYNLSGGTLDANALAGNTGEGRFVNIGWDGQAAMTVGGTGVLRAAGIRTDRNRAGTNGLASTLTVNPGGQVEIGGLGTEGQGADDGIVLAGGSLKATASSTWGGRFVATAATNSILDVDGYFARIAGNVEGTGTITVNDTTTGGVLEMDSGTGTRTWSATIAGATQMTKVGTGTLVLSGSNTNTANLLVNLGTLRITGDIDNALLDVFDGATLAGEGSTSGNVVLGFTSGANIALDASTPGAFTVNGNVTLNGTNLIVPAAPFSGTRTVLNYTGSLNSTNGSIVLADAASYRSANVSTAGGAVSVTVNAKDLVWTGTGGGLWDLSTTSGWSDAGNGDLFYFGDSVRFDDTATVTTATITGILKPGVVTVDSNINNFTWNGNATNYLAGNTSVLKKGTSTLTVNAPNTYTGGTVISNGQINLRNNTALGTGTVTLGDAATGTSNVSLYLDTNRVNFGTPVLVSNNGTGVAKLGSLASVGGSGDNNQFTNITLQRNVTFDSNGADRTDYENITGTGNITVIGTARSIFPTDGASWVGNVSVETTGANGSLQIGVASTAGNRIPDASNLNVGATGKVMMSTTGETISALTGSGTVTTNSPSGGTGTLSVGFGGASGEFSGLLTGNTTGQILALTKIGAGTQIISGNSTYSGATAINGGTLQVGNAGATGDLGTGAVTLAAGTTLTYNRTGAVTQEGALNGGAATLNINGDATTAVTLAVGGNFTGTVNVNNGTLIYGATNPTNTGANAPAVNIAAGATLTNLGAATHGHFGNLTMAGGATVTTGSGTGNYNTENYQLNGNVIVTGGSSAAVITREASRTNANSGLALRGPRTFTVADVASGADLIVSTELEPSDADTGVNQSAVVKAGPGTMLLNAVNSYTGGTTVNAGTLGGTGSVLGPLAVATGATLAPGASAGTFTVTGNADVDGILAIELDGALNDRLTVSGTLDITNTTLNVSTLAGGANQAAYIIASYGTLTGAAFGGGVTGVPVNYTVNYAYNDGISSNNIALVQSGGGNPYGDFETANGIAGAGGGADSDGDGIPNAIEFVLGTDPSGPGSDSNAARPTITLDGTYVNFTFRRSDASASMPALQQPYVQYGSDLTGWTTATAGQPVANPVLINTVPDGPGFSLVTVRIPKALAGPGAKIFARLRVDIP